VLTTSPLAIDVRDTGTTRHLTLAGDLDIGTAPAAHQAVSDAARSHADTIVLDLTALEFADSCAVHLVLTLHQAATEAGQRLVVLPGPPWVHDVFRLTGTDERLPFARTTGRFGPQRPA
jgi:anti-anti-sigma factor